MDEEIAAIRGYTVPKSRKFKPKNSYFQPKSIPNRILVFDTETEIGLYQNLKFGYFEIFQHGILEYPGLFYDAITISQKEQSTLEKFSQENNIKLYTLDEFRRIFLTECFDLGTLCVGFNLFFDLTRIAIKTTNARIKKKDSFSLLLSNNLHYPRLHLTHVSSTLSFIEWGNSKNGSNFKGNFLDLRTLVHALTDKKHTLDSACKTFGTNFQKSFVEHGKITIDYINYCINDVHSTHSLYLNAQKEFESYGLNIPNTQAYTPATIGKEFFRKMGIKSFAEKNPNFPKETIGNIMTCYYGGRTECKIRKTPVKSDLLDFLSMYPTVCTLQNLWSFVIAKQIVSQDATQEIKEFVENFKLENIQNKNLWAIFPAIVQVEPDEDVLPLRAKYGKKHEWNIGLPYVSYNDKLWYSLADVLASKLYTGKSPKILQAITFSPIGVQKELKEIDIHGIKINPYKQDLFKELIQYRQQLKKKGDRKQQIIKIITNAISYGIFVEITTFDESKQTPIDVYGLDHFTAHKTKIEKPGFMFNPIIAVAITSASRLLLATTEVLLSKFGATHAYCDTDSMVIPPQYTKKIQAFFEPLNPYNFKADIFKLEKSNVWFYGISAKRYCLYDIIDDKIVISDKYSAHGLGHLLNPTHLDDWHKELWKDILELHYDKVTMDELVAKYQNTHALSQLTISTPRIYNRLKSFNQNKDYYHQIKPGNFTLVGFSNMQNENTGELIKPIAPFRNPARHAVYEDFIDYHDEKGTKLQGKEFWKELWDIFREYLIHRESKFDGDIGILQRKYVKINGILHIGKESNNLDESEILGLNPDSYSVYENREELEKQFKEISHKILELRPKDVKKFGVSKQTLWNVKNMIKHSNFHRITFHTKSILIHVLTIQQF